jgi:hypothetical protein
VNNENVSIAQLDRATAFEMEPSGWKVEKLVKKGDYLYAVVRNHPHRIQYDYVLHHRIVMENHLKRLLTKNEVVHHKDGDKKNNSIENLELLTDVDHIRQHMSERGRLWVTIRCPGCLNIFEKPKNRTYLQKPKQKLQASCCSNRCRGVFARNVQLNRITPEVERAISENILLEYRKYSRDNAEETATTGSVETIRMSPEMVKT